MVQIFLRNILGILLIIGGFIGLFLPFLQGIAMILLGLALLGAGSVKQNAQRVKRYLLIVRKKIAPYLPFK